MYFLSLSVYIHTEIQREQKWTQQQEVYISKILGWIDIISWYEIHTPSFPALRLMYSCRAFGDPCNLCSSSWPGIPLYPLTLFLHSLSQDCFFSRMPFGWHARCGGLSIMGCLPSTSSVSQHRDGVNLEMHSEALIERVSRYTWTLG